MKIMQSLGWKYDEKSELLKEHNQEMLGKPLPYQDLGHFVIKNAVIESVDMSSKTMVVQGKVERWKKEETTHYIHFDDKPRFIEKGATTSDIKNIATGKTLNLAYQIKKGTLDHKFLRCMATDKEKLRAGLVDLFWVTGAIS